MTVEDEVVALRAENARLRVENAELRETLGRVEARVAELERRKTPPPAWAKATTPTDRRPKERTKRAPEHNKGRRREDPTRIVEHADERCPACAYALRCTDAASRGVGR